MRHTPGHTVGHTAGLIVTCALAACSTVQHRIDTRRIEVAFIVPEAVRMTEPSTNRVSLLLGSGRIATYDGGAVLRRQGHQFVIDRGPGTAVRGEHDIVDVRAVQLERTSWVAQSREPHRADQAEKGSSSVGWVLGSIAAVAVLLAVAFN